MKKLTLKIKGNNTIGNCITVNNTSSYTDTIIKNQQYNNVSVKSIRVVNNCNKDFLLSGKTLFTHKANMILKFFVHNATLIVVLFNP